MKKETDTLTTQQHIDQVDHQIKDADEKSEQYRQATWRLMEERQRLTVQLIREQKLLQGTKWKVGNWGGQVRLVPLSRVKSPEIQKIDDLLRTDYHCSVDMMENVVLRFDDSEIALHFKDSKAIMPFIQKYGLDVIVLDIREQITKKQQEIAALEEILTKVGK